LIEDFTKMENPGTVWSEITRLSFYIQKGIKV
jgi:hypothetical protein